MQLNRSMLLRAALLISVMTNLTILSCNIKADTGSCGGVTVTLPFTDVMGNAFFCQIAGAYFSGLTNGTSATTYSPADNVTREQMAAFTTRTLDQSLKRGSQRTVLEQNWTTQGPENLSITTVGAFPSSIKSDGADLWVVHQSNVSRVRASDGKLLDTWTGATNANSLLVAMGKIFVTRFNNPGSLYQIDPSLPAGTVTSLGLTLGNNPSGIAYDGQRIWTSNLGNGPLPGSVSIITLNPPTVTTITTGFANPSSIIYDGANMWVGDAGDSMLKKLDSSGAILQAVPVGSDPHKAVFDGLNIWVPNYISDTLTVVRATGVQAGTVLVTLSGNGLDRPRAAAFDGERIMVANNFGESVSLWKASDLTPIGTFSTGTGTSPAGVCSDGLNFWITLGNFEGQLARF